MTSCPIAPASGGRKPNAAATIPAELSTMPPIGTLEGDAAHLFPDVEKLIDLIQVRFEDYGSCCFSCNVAILAEGNTQPSLRERR